MRLRIVRFCCLRYHGDVGEAPNSFAAFFFIRELCGVLSSLVAPASSLDL
jgi:hypothetical protein